MTAPQPHLLLALVEQFAAVKAAARRGEFSLDAYDPARLMHLAAVITDIAAIGIEQRGQRR